MKKILFMLVCFFLFASPALAEEGVKIAIDGKSVAKIEDRRFPAGMAGLGNAFNAPCNSAGEGKASNMRAAVPEG